MAAEYLEIKKIHDSQTRTLVRTCHNYKNVALANEAFNECTGLWRSDNSFFTPLNYIKPIVDYTKQHDIFQPTKTPEKTQQLLILLILSVTMVALCPLKQKWEKISRNYRLEPENFSMIINLIASKFGKTNSDSSQKRSRYQNSGPFISYLN